MRQASGEGKADGLNPGGRGKGEDAARRAVLPGTGPAEDGSSQEGLAKSGAVNGGEAEGPVAGWRALLVAPYAMRLAALSVGIGLHAFNEVAIAPVLPLALEGLNGVVLLPYVYAVFFTLVIAGGLSASLLRRRFGAMRGLMLAGMLYCVGILSQVLAPDAGLLLMGRALQGLADGWIVALCYSLISDLFPKHLVPKVFAVEAMVWALAAVLGPFAGGLTVEFFGWRAALAVSLPCLVLFFLVLPQALRQEAGEASAAPVATQAKVSTTGRRSFRLLPPKFFSLSSTVGRGSWLLFLMTAAQSVSTVFLAYSLHHIIGLAPVRVGLVLITLSLTWSVVAIPVGSVEREASREKILRVGPLLQVIGVACVGAGLYHAVLPLVLVGQMLNGAAFAMVFASTSQAVIEDAAPEHRMRTASLLPSLETSGYVMGGAVMAGLSSGFAIPQRLAGSGPHPDVLLLWGGAGCLSLLAFWAARGVRLKPGHTRLEG
jgi:MFS family permease